MNWHMFTATDGQAVLMNLDASRVRHRIKADPQNAGCVFTMSGGGEQAITEPFAEVAALLTRR